MTDLKTVDMAVLQHMIKDTSDRVNLGQELLLKLKNELYRRIHGIDIGERFTFRNKEYQVVRLAHVPVVVTVKDGVIGKNQKYCEAWAEYNAGGWTTPFERPPLDLKGIKL